MEYDEEYASIFDEIESLQHPPINFEFQSAYINYKHINEPILYDFKAECIHAKVDLLETYRFVLTHKALYRFPISDLMNTESYIRIRNPRIRPVRELLSVEGSTKKSKTKNGIQLIGYKGSTCLFIDDVHLLFDFFQTLKKVSVQYNISKKFIQKEEIGQGNFSKVYVADSKIDNNKYAIKTIKKSILRKNKEALLFLKNEIEVLRIINHTNIVKLYEVFEGTHSIYLVFEYLQGGELLTYINSREKYSEDIVKQIMKNLLQALAYCHNLDIVHRDIKPENLIFIKSKEEEEFNLKIIDFGISTILTNEKCLTQKYGTAGYIAPEILEGCLTTDKADTFSSGVILHILLTGIFPFNDSSTKKITERNRLCFFNFNDKIWQNISQSGKDLCSKLLDKNPDTRYSADEALNHFWFKENINKPHELTEVKKKIICYQNDPNYDLCELKPENDTNGRLNLFLIAKKQEMNEMVEFTPRKANSKKDKTNKMRNTVDDSKIKFLNNYEVYKDFEKELNINKKSTNDKEEDKKQQYIIKFDSEADLASKNIPEEFSLSNMNMNKEKNSFSCINKLSSIKVSNITKKKMETFSNSSMMNLGLEEI